MTTNDKLAITPYAATPTFPSRFKIMALKTIMTIPEETSVTKEGTPLEKIPVIVFNEIVLFIK